MRLILPLAAILLVGAARNLPHHQHKAHKRHVDRANDDAVRALQDEELREWEDDQRVRRQLANTDMAAEEKMRMAEEHWEKFSAQRRRGGCKGRYRPAPPGPIRRRCPPRARPHDRITSGDAALQYPANSGYAYYPTDANLDNTAYEADRLEHEARLKQYEADRAAAEAQRALYEQEYRAAELRRAEEEERYRLALLERKQQEEESARNRQEDERRHYELNEQRQREYEDVLRRHRDQQENESSRRRAPCPALRHDILDGKTYEQIFLFAHKSGCSEEETRMAIDMARRQRIEQYALRYAYPVLFYSRSRGWIKINNEGERLRFEEQEADLDFERLRTQYQFVKEIEAARPHPHHPPAYTEEELEQSRKLADAEKESYAVIDKDNNENVAYGNEEEKAETVIDAIVVPQDEEDTVEEEPQPAPTKEEVEEETRREKEAKEEEKEALVNGVLDEIITHTEEEKENKTMEEEEKARIAEELEKELREAERLEKEKENEKEREEEEKDEGVKSVEKELPDEEEAVVGEEEKNEEQMKEEIKVEDPVIPDIGVELIVPVADVNEQPKEEDMEVEIPVADPVKPETEPVVAAVEKKELPKTEGTALEYDPNEQPW